jgi:hypothetical protein
MFPEDNIDETLETLEESVKTSESVLKNFKFDYTKKDFVLLDGSPVLNEEYEATKQWIQKFFRTDLGTLEIYDGYKFGTSYKKMMGRKDLDSTYILSELEREVREGFLLCPSINKVISYSAEKNGTYLSVRVVVKLNDGASAECNAQLG